MPETNRCPQCQAALAADAPRGLCPECLLRLGLQSNPSLAPGSGTAPTTPLAGRFTPPSIEELASKFPQLEILELLGQGGMGAVYKARQPKLNRLVALKVLPREFSVDPNFTERFTREAQALASLNHPHIVAVYDFGQAEGVCYFLMEFVDGVNLRETLRAGQLAPAEALRIVPQVCEALQYAHDEGIVHRDIKPENILLDRRGRVKIADFGLAKLVSRPESDQQLTVTHQVMGTPHYMAPEQIEHPTEVDHRADIFSLGVVFYEMLTGQLPLGRFAPPSEKVQIDVRLDDVVLRTLARDPERRYQHASEVKTAVESVASRTGFQPVPTVDAPPPSDVEPRLSRAALWGAIWAPFALLLPVLAIAILIPAYSRVESPRDAIALNSNPAIAPPNPGTTRVESPPPMHHMPTPQEAMMPMWFGVICAIVALPIAILGFSAPFGTTILGLVAIGKIRRSQGRLYGLPLAVADSLLFPLLLLDVIFIALLAGVIMGILALLYPAGPGDDRFLQTLPGWLILLIGLPFAGWIDYLIARKVWRTVTDFQPSRPAALPPLLSPVAAVTQHSPATVVYTPQRRIPLIVYVTAAIVFLLGWMLVGYMWNWRIPGLLFASIAMAGACYGLSRWVLHYRPEIVAEHRNFPRGKRIAIHVLSFVYIMAAYLLAVAAWSTAWDADIVKLDDVSTFEENYRGREHRLLQRLSTFSDSPQRVDMLEEFDHRIGGFDRPPFPRAAVMLAPLFGGGLLIFAAWMMWLEAKRFRSQGWCWTPIVTLSLLWFLAVSVVSVTNWLPFGMASGRWSATGLTWTHMVSMSADGSRIFDNAASWAQENGYSIDGQGEWRLITVPGSKDVARVRVVELRKASAFDRWEVTRHGRLTPEPTLTVNCVSGQNPPETSVHVGADTFGSPERPAWRAQVHSLADRLRDIKPATVPAEANTKADVPRDVDAYMKAMKLPAVQQAAVKQVLAKYREEYLALERRHTKIGRNEHGTVRVSIRPFSAECQALAQRCVAELGGIVEQKLVPRVEVGVLPKELFGIGGEGQVEVELSKVGEQYRWSEQITNWVPAPGQQRSAMNRLQYVSSLDQIPPEYRRFWSE